MTFPAYPEYKDIEGEWLARVPSHWSPKRLRFLAQLNPSKGEVSELSISTEVSFVPMEAISERGGLSLEQTRPLSDVLTGYTYFREGDVSIAKITPCFENGKGAIMRGLSAGVGFGTTELIVARARPDTTTPEFLDWLFRSPAFRTWGEAAMYGAGGQKRVPDDFVRDFISPGAPLAEQIAIAAFLDRETAKIDALVAEQRHLIALLKEKRKAIISHAVTKGLDPLARMKDSGIEWLGEVPAHWEVRLLSSVSTKITNGYVGPTRDILRDDGVRYLQSLHIKSNTIRFNTPYFVTQEWSEAHAKSILEAGDVLIVQTGDIGQSAVVTSEFEGCNCHALIIVSPLRSVLSGDWLAWLLNGAYGFNSLLAIQTGALHPHLNCGNVKGMAIPIPPLSEQADIVDYIAIETSRFGELSTEAQRGIDLLTERRAALISAAVTGKIDVRGSANVLSFPIDRVRARGLIATEIIERSAHQTTFGRVKFQKIAFLAEAHVGINELAGSYTREAAGPLDRTLIDEMESGAHSVAGIEHEQPGGPGTTVSYRLGEQPGAHRQELADWLGAERIAKLDKMITNCASLNTKQAEAVATLYGVWNDALLEGASPTDDEIISGFLNDWHPEKREKFRSSDLPEWLGWMRRHGVVPTGSGPKTTTGRFFV
jgi:type I restriction enzyme S subunit